MEHMEELMRMMEKDLEVMEMQRRGLPEGSLLVRSHQNLDGSVCQRLYRTFRDKDGKRRQQVISDREMYLAERLCRKKMLDRLIPLYRNNVQALGACLKKFREFNIFEVMKGIPEKYRRFGCLDIARRDFRGFHGAAGGMTAGEEYALWNSFEPYRNSYHWEGFSVGGTDGEMFRSKSEFIIAAMLRQAGVSYKYEVEAVLNGHRVYPDFVLLRPGSGKLLYWEHFGLLSDEGYRGRIGTRIEEYAEAGITLWDNLIVTFDRWGTGLDASVIRKIIDVFVL